MTIRRDRGVRQRRVAHSFRDLPHAGRRAGAGGLPAHPNAAEFPDLACEAVSLRAGGGTARLSRAVFLNSRALGPELTSPASWTPAKRSRGHRAGRAVGDQRRRRLLAPAVAVPGATATRKSSSWRSSRAWRG